MLFMAVALPCAGVAGADSIEQIIVVAHKDERSIRDIAANVTALSRADLKDQIATSVNDVFRYVPGVDYEAAGTRFGTEGINIRGIGGNRVAILVDGVPLSDQFDIGSFSNATRDFLDAGLIESIEVLHGPASALYGSSAIGGVVAVRTPDPSDIAANSGYGGDAIGTWRGNDASVHAQAMAAMGNRDLGLLLGASWRDGSQTDSAAADVSLDTRNYNRRTALAKLVGDDRRGNTWRASYIHQDSRTLSDMRSLLGSGRFRTTTALRGDDSYGMDALNLSYDFSSRGRLVDDGLVRVYYQVADIEQFTLDERAAASTPVSIDRLFAFEQDVRGIELNLWKDFTTGDVTHRLGLGVEYSEHHTEEYRDGLSTDLTSGAQTSNLLGEEFPLRDFPLSNTTDTSAFIEDSMNFRKVTVIAALRADRFELSPEADAMYLEDYPFAKPVSIDESELSPKLGVIVEVRSDLDLYLQYSHGFRAPPYSDANIGLELPLFNIRAVPNPDLKSESSDGLDLGLRLITVNAEARLSVFHTRYKDFIESKVNLGFDPLSGRVLFQSQNLTETRIEGIEAACSLRFGGDRRALGFDASAYFARGENRENGEALNSVGPPQAVLGLSWFSANERRQARLKATLTDGWSERDESKAELFKPAGYAVFDVYFLQQLGKRSTLRAGLHNLTDRTYWHWADIRGLSPTDPMVPYLARAGRSVSVSVNVNW